MMKRVLLILLVVWLSFTLAATPGRDSSQQRVKQILNQVSGGIVKVIAETDKVYIGTGIALNRDLVLTSELLVRVPNAKLTVLRTDQRRFPAHLKGRDPRSAVALLQLESPVLRPIPAAKKVEVGDWVAMVGAFYDQFPAVQQGVVSSVSPYAMIINGTAVPGSSGGAVVDAEGHLVAVIRGRFGYATAPDIRILGNSAEMTLIGGKARSTDLCYALPIARVHELAGQLQEYGRVRHGWLGAFLVSHYPDFTVRVDRVTGGSPAERAGLRRDDRILTVNGRAVDSIADVTRAMQGLSPGDTVRMDVQRDRVRRGILITLGVRPESQDPERSGADGNGWVSGSGSVAAEPSGFLPQFRRFILRADGQSGADFEDVKRHLEEMRVTVHDSSMEQIRREMKRLSGQVGMMEQGLLAAGTEDIHQLRSRLDELTKRSRKALDLRERQLKADRERLMKELRETRQRLEGLSGRRQKNKGTAAGGGDSV